jgi:circadian clock protein KaiC
MHAEKLPATLSRPKVRTGVAGLDEILHGGLPAGHNTVLVGGPGSGKTVLALQTLVHGARHNEPGIFVAFEENARQIVKNAGSFGWDLVALERKHLFFLDARVSPYDVPTGDFDLMGFLAQIEAKAHAMGAKRIVFDSIDVLLGNLGDVRKEQNEVHRVMEWLSRSGLTAILTAKVEATAWGEPLARYGFLQFMADCAIILSHQTVERISRRELRVLKYRGSAFAENAAPLVIGPEGVEVAHISARDRVFPVSSARISSGIARLDAMLCGGYFRGSTVLITGAPGTAKSTLSGAFVAAACAAKLRALYISFDEIAGEHVRNLSSVGIKLQPHLDNGRLKIYSARTEASGIEEHLVRIHRLMREHRADCVVFDPLSALFRAGAESSVQSASERLLHLTKSQGITTICTSLLATADLKVEGTPLEVSTIADTWIHLSYAVQAGERNRALTIVKSRGTAHSNQVRELVLSATGVTLADVYAAGGEVLMGTLRWQREMSEQAAQAEATRTLSRQRQVAAAAAAELAAQLELTRQQLDSKLAELKALAGEETDRRTTAAAFASTLRAKRRGDAEPQRAKKKVRR